MSNKYPGETKAQGGDSKSLGSFMKDGGPAKRVLMETHKKGGVVGSQQKAKRSLGGAVGPAAPGPNLAVTGGHYKKGGSVCHMAKIKRAMGGLTRAVDGAMNQGFDLGKFGKTDPSAPTQGPGMRGRMVKRPATSME